MNKAASSKSLRLNKETLRVLNQSSLEDVHGGTTPTTTFAVPYITPATPVTPATPEIVVITIAATVAATQRR